MEGGDPLRDLQPEHHRYWLGYRLVLEPRSESGHSWNEVKVMSLNEVHLLNLLLDARDDARARAKRKDDAP